MTQLQRIVIAPDQLQPPQLALTTEQQHYLCRVLRLGAGDRFIAMNGQGAAWLAQLGADDRSYAQILEARDTQTELPIALTLVAALPKGNGFDEVVRQCTELGVTCIAPVVSDRTLLKPSPQKLERWRRIVQEAAEQSERQIVPTLLEPVSFVHHLRSLDRATRPFLCVTRHSAPHLLSCLGDRSTDSDPATPPSITLAIGPEGGWTDSEVAHAIAAGYQPVTLGRRILRSLTAPIVALSIVAATWETS